MHILGFHLHLDRSQILSAGSAAVAAATRGGKTPLPSPNAEQRMLQ